MTRRHPRPELLFPKTRPSSDFPSAAHFIPSLAFAQPHASFRVVRSNTGCIGYQKGLHLTPWIGAKPATAFKPRMSAFRAHVSMEYQTWPAPKNRTTALRDDKPFQRQSSFHAEELHTSALGTNSSANTDIVLQLTASKDLTVNAYLKCPSSLRLWTRM
jgi:hypothetical protein